VQVEVYDVSTEEKLLSGRMVSVTQLPEGGEDGDMVVRYYLAKVSQAAPLIEEPMPGHADK